MRTVLVIDDDELVRTICRRALEAEGYTVTEAADGFSALASFAAQPADAVLCDIYMPEMDGIETINQLTSEYIGVKIVAMSSSFPSEWSLATLVRKLGAVEALAKPFTIDDLVAAVRGAVDDVRLDELVPDEVSEGPVA